jgi:hypothetical protein
MFVRSGIEAAMADTRQAAAPSMTAKANTTRALSPRLPLIGPGGAEVLLKLEGLGRAFR